MTERQHEDQMTLLLERAMSPVRASEDVVTRGVSRGRGAVRRRRTAQAVAIGSVAAVAATAPFYVGGGDDRGPTAPQGSDRASTAPVTEGLPPHLRRAQALLLEALPEPAVGHFGFTSVDYDPDGRGVGEILVSLGTGAPVDVARQDDRCDRAAESPADDDCVATDTGWVFTGPSLPDVSGAHPDLAGLEARYLGRDGSVVQLIAYNAPEANLGTEPTRPDPVLDADELVELVTATAWFA